jgi:hypothetical protein
MLRALITDSRSPAVSFGQAVSLHHIAIPVKHEPLCPLRDMEHTAELVAEIEFSELAISHAAVHYFSTPRDESSKVVPTLKRN